MKKDIAKSIRLSQKVFDYIDSQPGSSFNDKLDRLVELMDSAVPEKQAELKSLQMYIEKQRTELIQVTEKIDRLRRRLNQCEFYVDSLDGILQSICNDFPAGGSPPP